MINTVPVKNQGSNSFLNIPIFNATAKQIVSINRNNSANQVIRLMRNESWCTNCWYYVAVINNNTSVRANVNLNLAEIKEIAPSIV